MLFFPLKNKRSFATNKHKQNYSLTQLRINGSEHRKKGQNVEKSKNTFKFQFCFLFIDWSQTFGLFQAFSEV